MNSLRNKEINWRLLRILALETSGVLSDFSWIPTQKIVRCLKMWTLFLHYVWFNFHLSFVYFQGRGPTLFCTLLMNTPREHISNTIWWFGHYIICTGRIEVTLQCTQQCSTNKANENCVCVQKGGLIWSLYICRQTMPITTRCKDVQFVTWSTK